MGGADGDLGPPAFEAVKVGSGGGQEMPEVGFAQPAVGRSASPSHPDDLGEGQSPNPPAKSFRAGIPCQIPLIP
jgi:hypothetical protein